MSAPNPFAPTHEMEMRIRQWVNDGKSARWIADQLGETQYRVYNWCRSHGVKKERSIYTPFLIRAVAKLKQQGMMHAEVAQALGIKPHVSEKCWRKWQEQQPPEPIATPPPAVDPIQWMAASMPWVNHRDTTMAHSSGSPK